MYKEKVFLDAPCLGKLEKKYLCAAIDSGFVSSVGPFVPEFEKKMAEYLGVEDAVAIQNGTAALYMALYELGVGSGDEVIVPALTFIATVNPILYVGAKPVIVDVKADTWNIDPQTVKNAITAQTKAIIPVHLYGNPCDMSDILEIAKEHNLYVIEDATESLGALYKESQTGTLGDFGCFSFNGNKTITTGGGGLLVAKDKKKIERVRYLINQAKDKDMPSFHSEMGFNFRMTNIQAALGLAQLEQLDGFLEKKKNIFSLYSERLKEYVLFQQETDVSDSSRWLSSGIVTADYENFTGRMKTHELPFRKVFVSLTKMTYLDVFVKDGCPNAEQIHEKGICLASSVLNNIDFLKQSLNKVSS